jgi:hypothetical protein
MTIQTRETAWTIQRARMTTGSFVGGGDAFRLVAAVLLPADFVAPPLPAPAGRRPPFPPDLVDPLDPLDPPRPPAGLRPPLAPPLLPLLLPLLLPPDRVPDVPAPDVLALDPEPRAEPPLRPLLPDPELPEPRRVPPFPAFPVPPRGGVGRITSGESSL